MSKKKIVDSLTEDQKRVLQKASPALNRHVGSDFSKIIEEERKQILLRATPHARQPSMLWTKDRRLTRRFFVKRYLEFPRQLECEFSDRASRVLGQVDQELDLAGSNDIYVNVRCEESTLFFHVKRREILSRNGLLLIRLPADLYEVQRRAQLRYRTHGGDGFKVESGHLPFPAESLTVLDVSSGGIGVQVKFETETEADAFKLELDSRVQFHLDLGLFSFLAVGEIRYLRRIVDDETGMPSVRVGFRFVGLPQDTVEAIQIFVMERSYIRLREMFAG